MGSEMEGTLLKKDHLEKNQILSSAYIFLIWLAKQNRNAQMSLAI